MYISRHGTHGDSDDQFFQKSRLVMDYYAHSLEGKPPEEWQPLEEHLCNVAEMAAEFASSFGAKDWGALAGQHHDLGKGTNTWQAYLRKANGIVDEFAKYFAGRPNHSAIGAQWLFQNSKEAGKPLAYCIAGHHGGLPDWEGSPVSSLAEKVKENCPEIAVPMTSPASPANPALSFDPDRLGYQFQFLVRMLFSCLVDADFLDTEAFLDQMKSSWRAKYPKIDELHERFWKNFDVLRNNADPTSRVNGQRERVLADCIHAAEREPGLYSLTVPTGGGKTLASLAFALNHAVKHQKSRIIYVIPFTSIIEQNAGVFREMLGDDAVLEHHCNFLPDDMDWRTRLATENWDAPVVVTTNVQFFDSFYANRTSKCRKLHNVADSIVIFDEVQAIPVEKLRPCLEVIRELSLNYGVTSVLCTATQPAINYSEEFRIGLKNVREIVQDIPNLFHELKRTEEFFIGKSTESDIADQIMEKEQVLCIVNTRQQALDIYNALPKSEANVHLSALMYPAHRTRKLAEIRRRLLPENKLPCRVVSTTLIEAGVDVDFPSVYRAVAGIDSIAQAAGRCNRNGLSDTPLKVCVFEFPEDGGCSYFRLAAQSAAKLLVPFDGRLTDPQCVTKYFGDYFWKNEQRLDHDGIIGQLCLPAQNGNIQYREIANFQMIKSATVPVVIALEEEVTRLVHSLEFAEHKGGIFRKLQKYSVQIYPYQLEEIRGWLENPVPGVWVLRSRELYSEKTGLRLRPPEGDVFFG
jgi:CRISPR-associated endonuclease/helicase Cas3